jgi:PAS domain S-box-containing protein
MLLVFAMSFPCPLRADHMEQIFNLIPMGVVQASYEGKIMRVNDFCANLLGYTARQLQLLNLDDLSVPNDILAEKLQRQRCWRGETPHYRIEKRLRHRDGQVIWVEMDTLVVRDEQEQPQYLLSFWQNINDRKQAEIAYAENEKKFRQIFEEVPVGMAIIGFNQRLLKVNQTLCEMLGYTEAELLSRSFAILTHPDDAIQDAILAKQLYYGRIPHYQVEKRCITKQQGVIWVLLTAYVIRNEQGKAVNSLAMVRDITKQKEAQDFLKNSLQEKELFLREIHHRIKNNLHIVANLLEMQSQHFEDDQLVEVLTESQNRIYAMAMIHEQLYQLPRLDKVDFAQYLHSLVVNLLQSSGVDSDRLKVDFSSDAIYLNLETAIPCGLIVNELLTNTIKYAWRGMEEQHQRIILVKFAENNGRLVLTIGDNGNGIYPNLSQDSTGIGLRLVNLLVRQLNGAMEIVDQAGYQSGTQFQISFCELPTYARKRQPDGGHL